MTLNDLIRKAQDITSLFPSGNIPLIVNINLELKPTENGYIVDVWLEKDQQKN